MNSNQSISNDFRILGKLGEGSFAEVFKVKSTRNNTTNLFAIKRLKKRFQSIEEVNHLPEITACRCLQGHPNIVRLFEVLFDSANGYVALVFELLDYNLYEYVKIRNRPCDERQALLFIYQLLKAIAFLHSKNLFHRDIKPENCMINKSTLELKLVDFGSCRFDDHNSNDKYFTEYVSTRWYRAPECILTSGSYGKAVDIWAVGCMLFELLTTKPLFPGKHELDQINRIHQLVGSPSREVLSQFRKNPNTQISFSFPNRQPQDFSRILPPNITKNTVDLLKKLLIYDPYERITADKALAHPAFEIYAALDKKWHDTGEIVPYSVFFTAQIAQASRLGASFNTILNTNNGNNDIQNPDSTNPDSNISELHSNDFLNQNLNNYLTGNKIEFPEVQVKNNQNQNKYNGKPLNVHEPPAVSKSFAAPHPNYYENLSNGIEHQLSQQQQQQQKDQIKPSIPTGQMLKEARLRAAQRIREYNKKKYGANPIPKVKLQPQQQYHLPQPLIDKNKNNYNRTNQGIDAPKIVYQKPAPEIVQPRVPKKQLRYK